VYHLELRQFPHVARRFNQSEQQVLALAQPWVGEQWVEEAERKWNMNEAELTILEGPNLTMADLAMGRGWRNAQRRSEDVTERVLDRFRKGGGGEASATSGDDAAALAEVTGGAPDPGLLADSLGLELLGLLDTEGLVAPGRVWRLAQERLAGRPLAEGLALADRAVRSLHGRGLIVLQARSGDVLDAAQLETALGAIETWADGEQRPVLIARKG
jgi:hypothetical protein